MFASFAGLCNVKIFLFPRYSYYRLQFQFQLFQFQISVRISGFFLDTDTEIQFLFSLVQIFSIQLFSF